VRDGRRMCAAGMRHPSSCGPPTKRAAHYIRKIRTCPVFWSSLSAHRRLAFFCFGHDSRWPNGKMVEEIFNPEADARAGG
jgi:hypothetical protein